MNSRHRDSIATKSKSVCGGAAAAVLCLLFNASPALSQGIITTFAGNGAGVFAGDGGPATAASLNHPTGLAVDSSNNVYIADMDNYRVRRVTPGGFISTVAGNGVFGVGGDGGPATAASLGDVSSVAVDSAGNLYIADGNNHRVRKVFAGGTITTFAGTGVQGSTGDGGPAASAQLNRPIAVALDNAGNLYISDSSAHMVRRVNLATGIITKVAGNGQAAWTGDGGPAISAALQFPLGIALDQGGNLYIADAGNNAIRKVTPGGIISTVAGSGSRVGFGGDGGAAINASLNLPSGVKVDGAGTLFIGDSGNNRVRRVDGAGTITTLAGTGTDGFSGDGGPPSNALLSFPWGLTVDAAGAIYVADRANHRVRKITGVAAPPPPPPPPPSGLPKILSLSPAAATTTAQTYTVQVDDPSGALDIDIVNLLINNGLDGRQACYIAYSRPANMLFLVANDGSTLLPGIPLGSGSVSNSQCTLFGGGSSVVPSGTNLTLALNLSFTGTFGGDRVVYAAARSATQNSGWQTSGILIVPPAPATLPNSISVTPSSGTGLNANLSILYQDANSATNLQTAWALINNVLDGRSACYIVYYRPGNQVLLYPDSGDPAQAQGMILTGANSLSNSQCTVSAQGSSVVLNGSKMTVNLNVAFKPAFAGGKVVYTAVQTMGGAQNSSWRSLGIWKVQ